jgi:hypothetical protein
MIGLEKGAFSCTPFLLTTVIFILFDNHGAAHEIEVTR